MTASITRTPTQRSSAQWARKRAARFSFSVRARAALSSAPAASARASARAARPFDSRSTSFCSFTARSLWNCISSWACCSWTPRWLSSAPCSLTMVSRALSCTSESMCCAVRGNSSSALVRSPESSSVGSVGPPPLRPPAPGRISSTPPLPPTLATLRHSPSASAAPAGPPPSARDAAPSGAAALRGPARARRRAAMRVPMYTASTALRVAPSTPAGRASSAHGTRCTRTWRPSPAGPSPSPSSRPRPPRPATSSATRAARLSPTRSPTSLSSRNRRCRSPAAAPSAGLPPGGRRGPGAAHRLPASAPRARARSVSSSGAGPGSQGPGPGPEAGPPGAGSRTPAANPRPPPVGVGSIGAPPAWPRSARCARRGGREGCGAAADGWVSLAHAAFISA